jgi:hypothetical protein
MDESPRSACKHRVVISEVRKYHLGDLKKKSTAGRFMGMVFRGPTKLELFSLCSRQTFAVQQTAVDFGRTFYLFCLRVVELLHFPDAGVHCQPSDVHFNTPHHVVWLHINVSLYARRSTFKFTASLTVC